MDKMRAIEFFNRAVETGTFAAAARSFDVSTPAVTQLVATLERRLGTQLLHRTAKGLVLTADGERYREVARDVQVALAEVESRLGPRGAKACGTLTVGLRSGIGQNCVVPRLSDFMQQYPCVELRVVTVDALEEIDRLGVDLVVTTGWPPEKDFVVRPLAQSRNVVCAAPHYWLRHGTPLEPLALRDHRCLALRSSGGTILDQWSFQKVGITQAETQTQTVDITSQLVSDNICWIEQAACAGAGVIRASDFVLGQSLACGKLVAVLADWEPLDSPSHFVVYRPALRRSRLVRLFVDFLVEVFTELEAQRESLGKAPSVLVLQPAWFGRTRGKQSSFEARQKAGSNIKV